MQWEDKAFVLTVRRKNILELDVLNKENMRTTFEERLKWKNQ